MKNSSLCSHLGGSSLSLETFWRHNNYAGFSLVGNVMPGRYVIFHSGSFSDLCDSDHYEGVKLLLITDILQDYGTIHAEVEPRQLNTHLPSQQSILPCSYGGCLQPRRGMVRGLIGANLYHHHQRCCHNPWLSWTCR